MNGLFNDLLINGLISRLLRYEEICLILKEEVQFRRLSAVLEFLSSGLPDWCQIIRVSWMQQDKRHLFQFTENMTKIYDV